MSIRDNIVLLVGIMLTMAAFQACGGGPGAQTGSLEGAFGPYPVEFREIVQNHVAATYPGGQVLRNVIVRPPSTGWVLHDGQMLAGHVGQVDFSLKDQEQQTFRRVTFCYFLYQEAVLMFEEQEQAEWCSPTKQRGRE
ncbi:MAG TPA: hypothetical protein ENN39_03900 [Desulfonatronum sp.]|nr:hypothetical protein [Desulfonatronum sp.]